MKVLVVADGSRGDVQPMTVLAAQLEREGHAVTFAAPPSFRELAEAKGLTFTPLPFDSEAMIKAHPRAAMGGFVETLRVAPKLFVETTEGQLEVLPALAKQHDFILVGGVHAGVPSAAEHARIPWRWVLYTSIMIPSNAHPPVTAPIGRAPRFLNWCLWWLTKLLTNHLFREPINRARMRLALPPLSDVVPHIVCDNPIVAMEPELAPLPPEQSNADVIGYLDPGDGEPLSQPLEEFLASGPTPIYIGFGSMPDVDPEKTTHIFAEATERVGVRAIISRGWASFGASLPNHCLAIDPVSHPRLFARVSAIVHHGGAGTTAAATRAGKPQLVVPHIADQFFLGRRVHELGVAVKPLRRTRLTVDALAERLTKLLADAPMRERAEALGRTIRARPRAQNLSRLLVTRTGASLPVVPIGRRISIAPGAP